MGILNNDLDEKIKIGKNITDITQITEAGCYQSLGDCPNGPENANSGVYYNYISIKNGYIISIIAINNSDSNVYVSTNTTSDGSNYTNFGWKKLSTSNIDDFYKFNNLSYEDGLSTDQFILTLYKYSELNHAGIGVDPSGLIHIKCGLTDNAKDFVFNTSGDFQANSGDIVNNQGHRLSSTTATANAAYTMAQELQNKFNNLFSQDGNNLTINY